MTSPKSGRTPVEALTHEEKRSNIPTADAHSFVPPEVEAPRTLLYPRDPSLDPQLVWKGKDEQDSQDLPVLAPPIYIQEKIDPRVLIENLRRTAERPEDEPELTLFEMFDGLDEFDMVDFYKHEANWSNRMILGDSLEVMASLAEREDLRGKVQMLYIDPPYGIKFGSNWQASTRKRDVRDGKLEDATREVEQIKAFRDTWEFGIHSYLSYLRDRLVVARDLLGDSGSIFVQIGDENVHLVRGVLDEVLGSENFCSLITFKTTSGAGSFAGGTKVLAAVNSYLLWYAKDASIVKYRALFREKEAGGQGGGQYTWAEASDGERWTISTARPLREGDKIFQPTAMTSQTTRVGQTTVFPVIVNGRTYVPNKGGWKTNQEGMRRLLWAKRLMGIGNTLRYVRHLDDFPAFPFTNLWEDTVTSGFSDPKVYVVQTHSRVIERCLLMTTDPGDLVVDPTCGSGTTAYVAEQWGRRWITIDTSRVAIALARQRLMGAKLPYYLLADSVQGRAKEAELTGVRNPPGVNGMKEDVRKGFVYGRVPHVTLKSIANNPDIKEGMSRSEIDAAIARHAEGELLYDRPYEDRRKIRVAGPFTVESLSPHRSLTFDADLPLSERAAEKSADSSSYEKTILENLRTAGVQNGRRKERLEFEDIEPFGGKYVQAIGIQRNGGNGTPQRIAIALGPEYGTVSPNLVKEAAKEALKGQEHDILLVLGFAFDAMALETVEEFRPSDTSDFATVAGERHLGKLPVLLVRMNPDLAMGDELLKKTKAGNLFTVFGEPDIALEETADGCIVEIRGVDVYDPTTGEVRSNNPDEIAMWMIDTDYNGESFFVRHCYFSGGLDPYARLKKALKADIDEEAWATLYSTVSRPFPRPETGRIAVKAINHYGDEVLKIIEV
jgi:adenine-specific DNA-methyltransferase